MIFGYGCSSGCTAALSHVMVDAPGQWCYRFLLNLIMICIHVLLMFSVLDFL